MQDKEKLVALSLKHIEPIKIRKVRISSRRSKKSLHANEKNSNSEYGNFTAASQKSLIGFSNAGNMIKFDSNGLYSDNVIKTQDFFEGIQEINEKSENDDDSVIMQLNEMLNDKSSKNEKNRPCIEHPKPPMAGFKIKIKERINPIVSSRKLTQTKSYKNIQ